MRGGKTIVGVTAVTVGVILAAGCQLIAGVKDTLPYPADGGIGGAGGGTSGTGGATGCAPGAMIDCYSGPDGTKGVGICLAGKQTCRMDGSGYDACVGEVKPKAESCAAPEDENCDGHDCVQWAELFGDGADQQATALAVDASGNIFVVGTFAGEIALNGVKIGAKGSTDTFVLKLDPNGKAIWGKAFGDVGTQIGQAVTVDSTGSVIVAGFSATAFSPGDPQMTTVPAGLFVVKLDGDGKAVWSNGFGALGCGGPDDSAIAAMAVTSGNDVVIAGRYCGSIDFGNGALPSQLGSQDGFVALLGGGSGSATSGSGWSRVFGDSKEQRVNGIAIGATSGDIVIAGYLLGSLSLGTPSTSITSHGGYDMFVAQFQANGTPLLTAAFGDGEDQYATAIAEDTAGNAFISGNFRGTLDFGGGNSLATGTTNNAFLIKLDSILSYQWGTTFGGDQFFGAATDIDIDSSSNIFLAGIYSGGINLGADSIASKTGNIDIFLAKLTSTGKPLWAKTFDAGAGGLFGRMRLALNMQPVIAGFESGSTDFGAGVLTGIGSNDAYVAKFAP